MYKRFWQIALLLYSSLLLNLPAQAEVDWASVVWQNDLFVGRDGGGYTNGLFISLYDLSTEGQEAYQPPLLTKPLLWMLHDSKNSTSFSERTLGQAMITPKDISQKIPDPNDAPYAGLLFYRASHALVKKDFADLVQTTIGIVGPASEAEQAQKLVHKITGSEQPQGWDYQLKNEPVISLGRTAVWRFAVGQHMDTVLLAQAKIGNLESSLGSGAMLRYGSGLAQSFATTALYRGRTSSPAAINNGWYVYLGIEANYVFNNIFINGNTYRQSPSADLRHEQCKLTGGISYAWQNVSLTFSYSSATAADRRESSRDSFGALNLAWRL